MVVAGRSALYRPPTQVADDGIWIRHEGRLQASVTRLETQGRAVSKGSSSLDLQSGEVQIATGESDPAEDVFPPYCRVSQHRVDRAPAILASPVLYDMGDGGQLSGPVGLVLDRAPSRSCLGFGWCGVHLAIESLRKLLIAPVAISVVGVVIESDAMFE